MQLKSPIQWKKYPGIISKVIVIYTHNITRTVRYEIVFRGKVFTRINTQYDTFAITIEPNYEYANVTSEACLIHRDEKICYNRGQRMILNPVYFGQCRNKLFSHRISPGTGYCLNCGKPPYIQILMSIGGRKVIYSWNDCA